MAWGVGNRIAGRSGARLRRPQAPGAASGRVAARAVLRSRYLSKSPSYGPTIRNALDSSGSGPLIGSAYAVEPLVAVLDPPPRWWQRVACLHAAHRFGLGIGFTAESRPRRTAWNVPKDSTPAVSRFAPSSRDPDRRREPDPHPISGAPIKWAFCDSGGDTIVASFERPRPAVGTTPRAFSAWLSTCSAPCSASHFMPPCASPHASQIRLPSETRICFTAPRARAGLGLLRRSGF